MSDQEEKNLDNTDEEELEFEMDEEGRKDAAGEVKKLKEKLKVANEEKQKYLDAWQRAEADFRNLRKRDAEHLLDSIKNSNRDLISDILPALDSLDIALSQNNNEESNEWKKGLISIRSQILSTLEKHGLKTIDPKGEQFDPNFHEALRRVETKDASDQEILEVFQRGYMLHDKVIRTAKVSVAVHD